MKDLSARSVPRPDFTRLSIRVLHRVYMPVRNVVCIIDYIIEDIIRRERCNEKVENIYVVQSPAS